MEDLCKYLSSAPVCALACPCTNYTLVWHFHDWCHDICQRCKVTKRGRERAKGGVLLKRAIDGGQAILLSQTVGLDSHPTI